MSEPWGELITASTILELHEKVRKGPEKKLVSVAKEGCVEGSLGAAWNAEHFMREEDDTYRAGLVFAAFLLFYLAKNQCFTDGNKRTALASAHEVLSGLGLTIRATSDEIADFVVDIARGEVRTSRAVAAWMAGRLMELQ